MNEYCNSIVCYIIYSCTTLDNLLLVSLISLEICNRLSGSSNSKRIPVDLFWLFTPHFPSSWFPFILVYSCMLNFECSRSSLVQNCCFATSKLRPTIHPVSAKCRVTFIVFVDTIYYRPHILLGVSTFCMSLYWNRYYCVL